MASQIPQVLRATAKPVLSSSFTEARRRALNLYRAWYREVSASLSLSLSLSLWIKWHKCHFVYTSMQDWFWVCRSFHLTPPSLPVLLQIPHTIELYLLDISVQEGRQKLREQFYKNSHVRDPRVIDMLVIKVQNIHHG